MFYSCILACRALAQAEKKLEDSELKQEHTAAPAIQGQDNTNRTPEQLEHQEEEPPQVHLCAGAESSELEKAHSCTIKRCRNTASALRRQHPSAAGGLGVKGRALAGGHFGTSGVGHLGARGMVFEWVL